MAQLNFRYRTGKAAYVLDHLSWIRICIEDADLDSGGNLNADPCGSKSTALVYTVTLFAGAAAANVRPVCLPVQVQASLCGLWVHRKPASPHR